jgi:putative ABC transport system permease protein
METLIQDIRFGARTLLKNRSFTAIAIITLALGIGANTAIFSAMNSVLLRAFPLYDPGKLVMIWESNPKIEGFLSERLPVRLASYLRWKSDAHSFDDMGAFAQVSHNVAGKQRPEHVEAAKASPNFFHVLGVEPELGRTFDAQEGAPGSDRVAILSDAFYQSHFGSDANLSSKTLQLDGFTYSVIGVLPAKFHLPAMWEGMDQIKPEIWTPLDTTSGQPEQTLQNNRLMVIGRMKRPVTVAQARSEMQVMGKRLAQDDPKRYAGFGVNVFSIYNEDVGQTLRRSLLVLQSAVVFVLLIACANVANLLLTRATAREREIAVRVAIGAGRQRIVRQMLSESMLLSLLGGLVGLLLAYWSIHALGALAPEDIHGLHEMRLDPYVLAFTFVVVVVTGILFGIAPAVHALKQDVNESLTRGGRLSKLGGSNALRSLLVVSEISLALVLLIGGGLMARSLQALTTVDLGFRPERVLTGHISLPETKYKTEVQMTAFCSQVLERLRALPQVKAAAMASGLPLEDVSLTGLYAEGQDPQAFHDQVIDYQLVTEGYFDVMDSPLLRGRVFTPQEAEQQAKVIVANSAFVDRFWPGKNPIGKFVVLHAGKPNEQKFSVVGVVPDTHQLGPAVAARPEIYMPSRAFSDPKIVIRSDGDLTVLSSMLANSVMAVDREQPVYRVESFAKVASENVAEQRFISVLLVIFAALALVLASIGIYGVLSYSVTQRTGEIGIRMALGAQLADVLHLVLGQGTKLIALGVGSGLLIAFGLTRLMSSLLFGVKAADPMTFVAVPVLLAGIALLASYVPARRATKVDPMLALRYE